MNGETKKTRVDATNHIDPVQNQVKLLFVADIGQANDLAVRTFDGVVASVKHGA